MKKIITLIVLIFIIIFMPTRWLKYSYGSFLWIDVGNYFYRIQQIKYNGVLIAESYNTSTVIDIALFNNGIISAQILEKYTYCNSSWIEYYSIIEQKWLSKKEMLKIRYGNANTQYFSLKNIKTCDSCRADFEFILDQFDFIVRSKGKHDKEIEEKSLLKL